MYKEQAIEWLIEHNYLFYREETNNSQLEKGA